MKKVAVFGTFNVIHPGHLNFFRQAKKYGTKLYVVLARDKTVEDIKNYNPLGEMMRREKLLKLPMVDEVFLGDLQDRMKPIKEIKPDIICIGYDQKYFLDELEAYMAENGINIPIIRLEPYKPDRYKSSKLV